MTVSQIVALVIFVSMFILIVLDKIERHIVTLLCGLCTLCLVFGLCMRDFDAAMKTLNIKTIFTSDFWYAASEAEESTSGINWATIIFIFGMMVMVEGMAKAGFFRWLCLRLAKIVNYRPIRIFIVFMLMSFVLSMFIDSITVILFLAAVTIELARLLKFDPVPFIIAEVFCANLGGSATMCGDPPNIIIGTSLGYAFSDFLTNTGVIAFTCLAFILVYFVLVYRKSLVYDPAAIDFSKIPEPREAIESKTGFAISSAIFAVAVVLLITHASTHLTVATIGVTVALLTVLTSGKAIGHIMKRVDYKTLMFFIGLFVVVGGLEETGVLELIAEFIADICGNNIKLMIAIIIWVSAIASAFVDNIPFAATMIPVIKNLSATTACPISTLAWSLAVGTDIGGSATPIGASANVVGTSVAAKNGYRISWGRYCKVQAPATILVIAISTFMIFARYC